MKLTPIHKQGSYTLCKCQCGNEKLVQTYNLNAGKVKSCGCLKNQKKANSKLSTDQAIAIRKLYQEGEKVDWIARQFEVSGTTVSRIGRGIIWGWVSQTPSNP